MTKHLIAKDAVKKRIQELSKGMRTATGYYEELNKRVEELLSGSIGRAKANNRTTVMARDL